MPWWRGNYKNLGGFVNLRSATHPVYLPLLFSTLGGLTRLPCKIVMQKLLVEEWMEMLKQTQDVQCMYLIRFGQDSCGKMICGFARRALHSCKN